MSGLEYAVLVVLCGLLVVGAWSIVSAICKMVHGLVERRRLEKKELYERVKQLERDVEGSVWGSSFDMRIRELYDRVCRVENGEKGRSNRKH
jgi:hypothetical protein